MSRLSSTGRRPSLNLAGVEAMLTSYNSPAAPSVADLAGEFSVTQATVRKYLKMALGGLPRGRAACLTRPAQDVQALVAGIDTERLLGAGRVQLLLRRREAGVSVADLAQEFELPESRVVTLVASHVASVQDASPVTNVVEAPQPQAVEPPGAVAEAPPTQEV